MTGHYLYSYVVSRDYGFAPNPFHGFCTLATCKPRIRKSADVGSWIVGTGSSAKTRRLGGHLIFAMRVTEILDFDTYWQDPRFYCKRPNLHGSLMQAYGDNIYHIDSDTGLWVQKNSHHSYRDGSENLENKKHDLSSNRVLISDDFYYFGKEAPKIPRRLADKLCKKGASEKSKCFTKEFKNDVVAWLRTFCKTGYLGEPNDWQR